MSLTLTEARARAALISGISTQALFDLTGADSFTVRATLRFGCTRPGGSSFVELREAEDLTATLNGEPASYDGRRVTLRDLRADNVLEVRARLPFHHDGDGMTVVTDPADGERYLLALTAMDNAQRVLPCFDQPDLKSTFAVSATAPEHWTVLANGRVGSSGRGRWEFTTTPPLPAYLLFLGAGPWTSLTWDEPYADGTLPFGWHARASQRADLARDFPMLREITSACFRHYTRVFTEPYAFADYQQVFAPGINWGAMEFPGCVAFHEAGLPRGEPSAGQRQWIAEVIAHEMAHMWFGDLVTMRWWEDSWLNESFADYMGYQVAGAAAGFDDAWTMAALDRKPTAFRADRRRSTHPVAEDAEHVPDVDTAYTNFDMITYAKGNAVLRQLVVWLGEETFLAGVNAYLSAHALGNASLADLLDALDSVTDRDVRGWAEAYLRTTGFDRILLTREDEVPVLRRDGSRPHRFTVTAYDDDLRVVGARTVDLSDDAPVALREFAGRAVVADSADEAYAEVVLDEASWERLARGLPDVESPLTRAKVCALAAEGLSSGRHTLASYLDLVGRHLRTERHPAVFEGAAELALDAVRAHARPVEAGAALDVFAAAAREALASGDEGLVVGAGRLLATTLADAGLLEEWLAGSAPLPRADPDTRWLIVQRLAALGDARWVDPELAREHTVTAELAALTARAAAPTPAAKAEAWARLMSGELSNREFAATASGLWGWTQAALVAPYVERFPADAVALAARSGQSMGKVIGEAFPVLPLDTGTLRLLRERLAQALSGEVPTVVGRSLRDRADDLDRLLTTRV